MIGNVPDSDRTFWSTIAAETPYGYGALLASAFKDLNPLASEAEQIAAVELQRGGARRALAS